MILHDPAASSIVVAAATNSFPKAAVSRAVASPAVNAHTRRPLCDSEIATPGTDNATRIAASSQWPNSVESVLRNFRRAGVLKNRSSAVTTVPISSAPGSAGDISPPTASMRVACAALACRVNTESREMAARLANASPRKPKLATRSRSSSVRILLVAWRAKASGKSAAAMPWPLSATRMRLTPPCSSSISMRVAPASRLFSSNSFRAAAGRSTTSPAAI